MQQILILGGGFAGLWSAAGAARLLDQRGIAPDRIRVTLVNRDDWHSIRVRNYERISPTSGSPWPRCWSRSGSTAWSATSPR